MQMLQDLSLSQYLQEHLRSRKCLLRCPGLRQLHQEEQQRAVDILCILFLLVEGLPNRMMIIRGPA